MPYYNLNIKLQEDNESTSKFASQWLNEYQKAPIFFGESTPEELANGQTEYHPKAKNEAKAFVNLLRDDPDAKIVSIQEGRIWIYQVSGPLEYGQYEFIYANKKLDKDEYVKPKYYPIKILKSLPVGEAPYILAAMKSSQAFSRGTFTRIDKHPEKYDGNVAAIRALLGDSSGWKIDPLRCLSSVELETLIARIMEEHGAFVPAYRGATLKGIDIFAEFDGGVPASVTPAINSDRLDIQVKTDIHGFGSIDELKAFLDGDASLLVTADKRPHEELVNYHKGNKYLTATEVRSLLEACPVAKCWFDRSLSWLPVACREW